MTRTVASLLVLLALGCGGEPTPEPDPLAEGWRAAQAGDHEGARALYAAATDARPDDLEAWLGSAREALRAERPADARGAAERAVELAPESADAHELLGRALLAAANEATPSDADTPSPEVADDEAPAEGPAATAAAELARALELAPDRSRLRFPLARARERAGDLGAAVEAYRAAAEAGVQPARALAAASRTRLDALGARPASETLLREIEQELDRAESLAGEDEAARGAIRGLRRRIARKRRDVAAVDSDGRIERDADAARMRLDRHLAIAQSAGLLGALQNPTPSVFGGGALTDDAMAALVGAGSIGAGRNDGFGGLSGRERGGPARGGGGTAEGIGGLGSLRPGGRLGTDERAEPVERGSASIGAVSVRGPHDEALVRAVLRRFLNQIRYCYQRERQRDPTLAGGLTLAFTIDADGSTRNTRVASSTVGDVGSCAARVLSRARYPSAEGTSAAEVTYRFE